MVITTGTQELASQTRVIKSRVDEATAFLKKLANRDRLLVVCALVEGERSVRELEGLLDIRQPGLSQQLAELRSAGMIEGWHPFCSWRSTAALRA